MQLKFKMIREIFACLYTHIDLNFYLNELYLNVPGAGLISGPGLCYEAQLTVSGSGSGGETGELVLLMDPSSDSGLSLSHCACLRPLCLTSLLSLTTASVSAAARWPLPAAPAAAQSLCLLASPRPAVTPAPAVAAPRPLRLPPAHKTQGCWHLAE